MIQIKQRYVSGYNSFVVQGLKIKSHNTMYLLETFENKSGHFAAFEQPELFINELRDCFRLMR
ncbi:uncharacterized protein Dvar_49050 [Desulfosarcina variabilis str. Montpellier]